VADQVERDTGTGGTGDLKPAPVKPIGGVTNHYHFAPVNVGTMLNGAGDPKMSPFHNAAVASPGGGMLDVQNGR